MIEANRIWYTVYQRNASCPLDLQFPVKEGIGMSLYDLAIAFLRSGLMGYGGGPSVIPLIRYEAVEKYRWMSDDEFGDVLALANALPGPIATKMAAYIGYRVKGWPGAAVAVLAHIVPSAVAMIALVGSLAALQGVAVVRGMIRAVSPVIGVMLAVMAVEFFRKAWRGMGAAWATGLTALSLVTVAVAGMHPALVIAAFLAGAWGKVTLERRGGRRGDVSPPQSTEHSDDSRLAMEGEGQGKR